MRLGVRVKESRQMREYSSGASTQVPVGIVVCIGKRCIQRKLGLNGKIVEYERCYLDGSGLYRDNEKAACPSTVDRRGLVARTETSPC